MRRKVSPDSLSDITELVATASQKMGAGAAGVDDCLKRSLDRLRGLQRPDGSFEGEVVWCPMILAQYVILRGFLRRPLSERVVARMVRHFEVTRRAGGGWGLHAEAAPYVFVTTLAYVALRLLGVSAEAALTSDARRWLHAQKSGVLGIPSWGKFWLAMAGLYDYRGMNPCPPELFLLPDRSPIHPNHLYCHTRYIYLAISFLYGSRFRGDLGPITVELRRELYREPYDAIDFACHRHDLAATDLYVAPSRGLRAAWNAMALFERLTQKLAPLRAFRHRALDRCLHRIRFEQEASCFQGLSPVNGILNTIALYANDPHDPLIEPSLAGIESWRWDDAHDGTRFAGARSTTWDTAFAVLALLAGPANSDTIVRGASEFLDQAQEKSELADGKSEARDSIHGGWCFSDGRHRWPVSDCAAEALSALLAANAANVVEAANQVPIERQEAAVRFVLDRQNDDGGFGTYERRRGLSWLERLNPSEMFGNCMTELSYIECTASAIIALCRFREQWPNRLREPVDDAVAGACAFLRQQQLADGSFAGFWGINFTYATWFAVAALRAAGAERTDPALIRSAKWLVGKQKSDGGWGEHFSGCLNGSYVEHPQSQAVMTSWALLALIDVVGPDVEPVRRGIAWLCQTQRPDGSWPDGAVNGVFFGAAMLSYRLYPAYFPHWVLNRYRALISNVEHD
jgi:squalene/oxidosqualene cyclase-like protein